jgi:hypothetical protein
MSLCRHEVLIKRMIVCARSLYSFFLKFISVDDKNVSAGSSRLEFFTEFLTFLELVRDFIVSYQLRFVHCKHKSCSVTELQSVYLEHRELGPGVSVTLQAGRELW